MTHEEIGCAVAYALARGLGKMPNDLEIERACREVLEWATHAELLSLLLDGQIDLAYRQRGIGTLTVLNPRGGAQ